MQRTYRITSFHVPLYSVRYLRIIFLYPTVKIKQGHMTLIHCDFLAHLPIVFIFVKIFQKKVGGAFQVETKFCISIEVVNVCNWCIFQYSNFKMV